MSVVSDSSPTTPQSDLDELLRSRPRIKRDVLFAKTPNGVIFHNTDQGFQITARSGYEFAVRVVPFLDGSNRLGDLCDALPEPHRPMLISMVRSLLERGFVRDVGDREQAPPDLDPAVAAHFATQIAYIDHYADDAAHRFAAMRTRRVAVLGSDHMARWAVLSLLRNGVENVGVSPDLELGGRRGSSIQDECSTLAAAGVATTVRPLTGVTWDDLAGYDAVLVCGPSGGSRTVLDLMTAGIPDGVILIPAAVLRQRVVVGPLMTADTQGCWVCGLIRLSTTSDPAETADLWAELAAGVPPAGGPPLSRSLASMLGNLMGYDVFRWATGAMPAETQGALVFQNVESMDVAAEPLLPHPACPHCATAPAPGPVTAVPEIRPLPDPEEIDRVERSNQAYRAGTAHALLIGPAAGVLSGYQDGPITQLPMRVGRIGLGLGAGSHRAITGFDLHTTLDARLRAVEVAAATYADSLGHRLPAAALTGVDRLDVSRIQQRVTGSEADHGPLFPATLLSSRECVAVPRAALWPSGPLNAAGGYRRSGAGLAAAGSPAPALGEGLLSALGLRDLLDTVSSGSPAARFPVAGLGGDGRVAYLVKTLSTLGLEADLLRLDRGGAWTTVLARTPEPVGGAATWALATALDPVTAVVRVLVDLVGKVQVSRESDAPDVGADLLEAFDPYTLVVAEGEGPDAADVGWEDVFAEMARVGLDAVAADLTTPDLHRGGITVLRVLLVQAADVKGGHRG